MGGCNVSVGGGSGVCGEGLKDCGMSLERGKDNLLFWEWGGRLGVDGVTCNAEGSRGL